MSHLPRRLAAETGGIQISVLLALAAAGVLIYAALSATSGDPDLYGRLAVPSNTLVELPAAEVEISYVQPEPADGAAAAPPPPDLRIAVVDPETREPITVNSYGGSESTEAGEVLRPIARVDPPGSGQYEIKVSASPSAAKLGQVALGESPIGAVGDRLSNLGDQVTSRYGIIAGLLLLLAILGPRVRRAF